MLVTFKQLVILAANNNKLNKIGLSEILNIEFFILSIAPVTEQRKIDRLLSQINGRAYFIKTFI